MNINFAAGIDIFLAAAAFTLKQVRQIREGNVVLDGVELEIMQGEITALVGASGAGKTSLLRLLNRLDDPTSGEILYDSKPINRYDVQELRRRIGFVFQTPVMFPGTLRDNLRTAIMLGKQTEQSGGDGADNKDGNEQRIAEALRLAELDAALLGEQDGGRLSVGQKQRANIARALVTAPDVLLMDEPTSALDPETADRLMDTIRRLKQERKLTVVMVTHRLAEARRVSDTIIVMERGRIVEAGATKGVFERASIRFC